MPFRMGLIGFAGSRLQLSTLLPVATCDAPNNSEKRLRNAVQRCMRGFTIEITPAAAARIKSFAPSATGLPAGRRVNVTNLVGTDMGASTRTCARLAAAGLSPVAHVPARAFGSRAELDCFLCDLRGVGVHEVLVIGGDADEPACASLAEAMAVLDSGLLQKHGFERVGVAAHPEGHPTVDSAALRDAMLRKASWAQRTGVELYYETQFCFEAEPIVAWERSMRRELRELLGPMASLPRVRLGVAGPAKVSSLMRFAAFSGVGSALRFAARNSKSVAKLATTAAPDALVVGVAMHMDNEPDCLIEGLHLFPLGGFCATIHWANAVAAGDFVLGTNACGFTVADTYNI